MTSFWAILFLAVAGGWAGALVLGMLAMRLLRHDVFVLAPLVDLFGTWAGALGIGLCERGNGSDETAVPRVGDGNFAFARNRFATVRHDMVNETR